jgi:colanic acid/amylovoran biosynthesis glycosyltransferase
MRARKLSTAGLSSPCTRRYKTAAMPRAAVFSTNFLDYSQTFVHQEVSHHTRYQVEVFCRKRMYPERFPFAPVHEGGAWYGLSRHSAGFQRRLRAGQFDLVHGHFGTGSLYALPYAEQLGLPLVVTFHGYDVPLLTGPRRFLPQNWLYALLAPGLFRRMTLGLCASSELLEMLVAAGIPRERLRLYQLGVDIAAFSRGERSALAQVVMIGRFVEKKGFEYGLRAFASALARGSRAELTMVGSGERESRYRALVQELGIAAHVRFAGALSPPAVAKTLSQADVLMAPSVVAANGDRESGVIVVKEASASEVAVLGTQHGGIPEIIEDGVTGYLVAERDVDTLSARLSRLLDDRAHAAEFGQRGRVKMEREYDLARRVLALEAHYDEAIALARGAR